jgi:hypothetical protein
MKDDDLQLYDPNFRVSDQQNTTRSGEVVQLAEHQQLAGGIVKLCFHLLSPREREFLYSVKLQRKLSPKQQKWFDDIRHRLGQAIQDLVREERRQLVEKYAGKKDPAT